MLKLTIIFFIKKISIIVHILIANVRLFMKQERIDQKKISYFVYVFRTTKNNQKYSSVSLYLSEYSKN